MIYATTDAANDAEDLVSCPYSNAEIHGCIPLVAEKIKSIRLSFAGYCHIANTSVVCESRTDTNKAPTKHMLKTSMKDAEMERWKLRGGAKCLKRQI